MQKITPFLWFDDKAEEAANFYVSILKRVMEAMLQMDKIDIQTLKQAYEQP
jgi:predicted 3-demethylubiquinone-9 3-methyltransferase (glyoxalase superfamily)